MRTKQTFKPEDLSLSPIGDFRKSVKDKLEGDDVQGDERRMLYATVVALLRALVIALRATGWSNWSETEWKEVRSRLREYLSEIERQPLGRKAMDSVDFQQSGSSLPPFPKANSALNSAYSWIWPLVGRPGIIVVATSRKGSSKLTLQNEFVREWSDAAVPDDDALDAIERALQRELLPDGVEFAPYAVIEKPISERNRRPRAKREDEMEVAGGEPGATMSGPAASMLERQAQFEDKAKVAAREPGSVTSEGVWSPPMTKDRFAFMIGTSLTSLRRGIQKQQYHVRGKRQHFEFRLDRLDSDEKEKYEHVKEEADAEREREIKTKLSHKKKSSKKE